MPTEPVLTERPGSPSIQSPVSHRRAAWPRGCINTNNLFLSWWRSTTTCSSISRQCTRPKGNAAFPVLYMQDGQNLFDPETSFIKGNYWRMGETADALIEADAIEPLIIVGIYNAGERRIDEYTPVEDRRLGGGHADAYGRMLVEELKPFVDVQYRTLPGAENCGMGGSSLGGLVTLYLGLRYPAVFSRLAVMSPSVWWRKRTILRTVAALATKT